MQDLKEPDGMLHSVLERVKKDHTLMLAIRENFINIYYRGGNLLNIKELAAGTYKASFDEQYNKSGVSIPESPSKITRKVDTEKWVASFPIRKTIMDEYFSIYGKSEREFQQLLARENNYSSISNESEYFISDIEVTEPYARFDIIAIRWLANDRKTGNKCKIALIEMKYGDGALAGNASLLKHLEDMNRLFSSKDRYPALFETVQNQFNQLDELGLLKFNKGVSNTKVELITKEKPEVIFILANHNPRSPKLKGILSDPRIDEYAASKRFDLRFYVASFAGYGLHADCMKTLSEFRNLV
jgi:hypothetical protein